MSTATRPKARMIRACCALCLPCLTLPYFMLKVTRMLLLVHLLITLCNRAKRSRGIKFGRVWLEPCSLVGPHMRTSASLLRLILMPAKAHPLYLTFLTLPCLTSTDISNLCTTTASSDPPQDAALIHTLSPYHIVTMVANDKPAGTLRYEEKPVYTTSNGCPVKGWYIPKFLYSSMPMLNVVPLDREHPLRVPSFTLLPPRSNAETRTCVDPESSQRVGQNGPLLLQDFHLIDLLAHFDRERIPERVVHAKGAGAYGEFEVTHDISDLVS